MAKEEGKGRFRGFRAILRVQSYKKGGFGGFRRFRGTVSQGAALLKGSENFSARFQRHCASQDAASPEGSEDFSAIPVVECGGEGRGGEGKVQRFPSYPKGYRAAQREDSKGSMIRTARCRRGTLKSTALQEGRAQKCRVAGKKGRVQRGWSYLGYV